MNHHNTKVFEALLKHAQADPNIKTRTVNLKWLNDVYKPFVEACESFEPLTDPDMTEAVSDCAIRTVGNQLFYLGAMLAKFNDEPFDLVMAKVSFAVQTHLIHSLNETRKQRMKT